MLHVPLLLFWFAQEQGFHCFPGFAFLTANIQWYRKESYCLFLLATTAYICTHTCRLGFLYLLFLLGLTYQYTWIMLFSLLFAVRASQPVKYISTTTGEKQRSLLRRIITDWKTPVSLIQS